MAPRRHERRGAADRYGRHERKVGIRLCTREEPTKPQPDFERMPGYRSLPAVAITVAPAITAIGAVAARGRIAVVAIRGIAAVAVDAGRPMCWTATDGAAPALGRTRADEVALTSAKPPQDGNHQAPGAGRGVGPRLGQRAELSACVDDALEMANRSNVELGQVVLSAHRHHLAGGEVFEHAQQLAPIGLSATRLLPVEHHTTLGAELVELRIKRLPVGANFGRSRQGGFGGLIRSYLLQFRRFLWRFCGISMGYKGSKPKVSISKFFAYAAARRASRAGEGGRDRCATWNSVAFVFHKVRLSSSRGARRRDLGRETGRSEDPSMSTFSQKEKSTTDRRRLFWRKSSRGAQCRMGR